MAIRKLRWLIMEQLKTHRKKSLKTNVIPGSYFQCLVSCQAIIMRTQQPFADKINKGIKKMELSDYINFLELKRYNAEYNQAVR